MRILITNDDGIHAEGLAVLVEAAKAFGQVTVVAPKFEQSGKSHGIELHKAFEVKKVSYPSGTEAYTVDSTPADCVRFAVLGLGKTYDLVLSGINNGLNLGCDIIYSGTAGAVFEAAALGFRAMAISAPPGALAAAAEQFDALTAYFRRYDLLSCHGLYNINIPADAKGIRITRQGGPYYSDDFVHQGDDLYMPQGKCIYQDRQDLSLDTDAVMHGYVSVTPLTVDRTDQAVFEALAGQPE